MGQCAYTRRLGLVEGAGASLDAGVLTPRWKAANTSGAGKN